MIRKLLPILGITFIDIIGFSMLIPIMPYFVTHFGMSPFIVGVLFSVFSFCGLVSAPIWGYVSDRIGRKTVLIISQIGATIGWAIMGFVPQIAGTIAIPAIAVIFIARVIEGVSGGNISITQAYVADLVEAKDRARAFGLIGAMFGSGMVFGPLIGAAMFGPFGFPGPFLSAAVLQIATLLLTIFMLPESRSKNEDEALPTMGAIFQSFGKPRLARVLWQKLAIALSLYGWFAVIALYLQGQLKFNMIETNIFFSVFAVVNVFCNAVLVGRISAAVGDRTMSNVGLGSLVVGFASVPFVHNIPMLTVTMLLFSFGIALTNSGITALISNAATDNEQGTVLGTSSSLDSLSGIVAPPISTGLLSAYGARFAGVESLALATVALVMGFVVARGEQPASGDTVATTADA